MENKRTGMGEFQLEKNKPDRATMRPGCVSACIYYATYVWRDRWTNRGVKTLSKHVG